MNRRHGKHGSARNGVMGCGLAALALVIASGCSGVSGMLDGCSDADESIAAEVMKQTETNFQVGPDPENIVSKVEYVRAKTVELPEDLREFGADRLLTVTVKIFFDDLAGSGFNGTEDGGFFALSSDDEVIGPVDDGGRDLFTVPEPSGAEWAQYADRVTDSEELQVLFRCAGS